MDRDFQSFLKTGGIQDETDGTKTPQMTSIPESHIHLLDLIAKSMIANLPKTFWEQAFLTTNYVYNRSPSTTQNGKTPYEMMWERLPRIDHLRVVGCKAVVHIPKESWQPPDIPGKIVRFVGYASNSPCYKLWDGKSFKFIESRDVTFDENSFKISYHDTHLP